MKHEIQKLRNDVEMKKESFTEAKKRLDSIVEACQHEFGETIPDHIYHPAYTSPGDPPGTMGVDWRGPCHVNATTEKQWKRICDICGKVEYTQRIKKEVRVKELPEWPDDKKYSGDYFNFPEEGGYSKLDM